MTTRISLVLAGLVAGLVLASSASASTVVDGTANWGVKQSFRNYVIGAAGGSYDASNGATKLEDGTIDFTPGSGTIDLAEVTGDVTFGGSVHFTGHSGALDVTVTDPPVVYDGTSGTLYADVTSKSLSTGDTESFPGVDFATLDLTGAAPVQEGDSIVADRNTATLTEDGSAAFAGFYPAGTALDPVSFAVEYSDEPISPGALAKPNAKQTVSKSKKTVKLGKATCGAACDLKVPNEVTTKIKGGKKAGKKVKFKVAAPDQLEAGESATVKATISGSSLTKLSKGGKAKLSASLVLSADGVDEKTKTKVTVAAK